MTKQLIANKARKTQKLFVQGYVHAKTSCIKLIISHASQAFV